MTVFRTYCEISLHIRTDKALIRHYFTKTRLVILKILQPKKGKFSDKKSDIFHISAQNIDCVYSLEPPRRGGSNEYPQSIFSLAK